MKREEYWIIHRPGNPLEYPDEVPTIDKILSGNYFPGDILDQASCYFSDYRNDMETRNMISVLKSAQNDPDYEVTIYRGAPFGELNTGDWVTLSKEYAQQYAANGPYSGSKSSSVHSYRVKAGELSFDGDSIYEFGYWGSRKEENK